MEYVNEIVWTKDSADCIQSIRKRSFKHYRYVTVRTRLLGKEISNDPINQKFLKK